MTIQLTTRSDLYEFPDGNGPNGFYIPVGGEEEPASDPEIILPLWNPDQTH